MYDSIEDIANLFLATLSEMCPVDNSNKDKETHLVQTIVVKILDDNTAEITIGNDELKYARHTNEYWKIDVEYFKNGKKRPPSNIAQLKSRHSNPPGVNPNLYWIDIALEQVATLLADINRGRVFYSGYYNSYQNI